jgi:hypothetical protein
VLVVMSTFQDVAPCSLVETDRRFRGAYICIIPRLQKHREPCNYRNKRIKYASDAEPIRPGALVLSALAVKWRGTV